MKCPTCEKLFRSEANLTRHMNTVHSSKRYGCPMCIKKFTTKWYVKKHLRTVHGKEEKDTSSYPLECKVCGKRYKSTGGLCYHIDSQHNDEVHHCHICIRRFATNTLLQQHMKRNHDNFQYEQRLLKGKRLLEFMVEECVPEIVMSAEDLKLVNLYKMYIYQKVNTWMDDVVYE